EMVPTVKLPGMGLWMGWLAANVLGLLVAVGLGATAVWAVITVVLSAEEVRLEERIVAGLATVAVGTTLTAFALSWAQFRVLRRVFWLMKRGEWVSATAVGLGVVWVLGAIPFALRLVLEETELGESIILPDLSSLSRVPVAWLGLALGFIVGAILGTTQRVVLKRYIVGAKWWVPAHIVGWSLALMLASQARDPLLSGKPLVATAPVALGWLALAAAIVAAINGFVLVWLARRRAEAAAYQ
ncbi:MAG TPA: hypothetical protein VFR15_13485, partial [Chloroflexia bacterium]|nr:hypothetical protein [Chloroflexia bacterium]